MNEVSVTAGYICLFGYCVFSAEIENKLSNTVITSVQIQILHEDNKSDDGTIKTDFGLTETGLWVEPGKSQKQGFSGLMFKPKYNHLLGEKEPYTWRVTSVKGLTIKLK